ncbi:MAG: GNAT family N-acetyltransferase [Candidatus Aminicenantes bacterium]|nr:GNAT family N-acetyltransferase [Candidatus Aminicenantes bacterium]
MEMKKNKQLPGTLTVEPLGRKNWTDFVHLFGSRGACGNCWCMYPRLKNQEFEQGKKNQGNKKAMKKIVWAGKPAGLLGFFEGRAIAWCAFAPRQDFSRLERSRIHKRIDDLPVWSIPCLFIARDFRKKGVSNLLLRAVTKYAREKKIKILEAYPLDPARGKLPDAFAWHGLVRSFAAAGFVVVDRTSKNRPMVRYYS